MSKIALATAVVALTAAVPLTMGHAEAQSYLPAGATPPWGTTTTPTATTPTTATETKPVPTPATTPAMESPRTSADLGTTTPIQGTTTPIRAVSLRSGPNTGSPVIGTLRPGMVVQVLASANYGWMQVETPAGSGWAYGSYFAPVGSTIVVQHPEPPEEAIVR